MNVFYRNHMGNDLEVINDARISFAKISQPAGFHEVDITNPCELAERTQVRVHDLNPKDQRLIEFLARGCRNEKWQEALESITGEHTHGLTRDEGERLMAWIKHLPTHWTPFAQQVIKLRLKAPVPVRTQAYKSKIGFVENEESRRYIDSTPELFIPEFRSRPEGSIKQGSGGVHPENAELRVDYAAHCYASIDKYEEYIQRGVAPEQARFVLPQGVYVNWVWTGSLYAYAEFYNKRADRSHAQGEIADLADEIATIIEPLFPVSWAALTA